MASRIYLNLSALAAMLVSALLSAGCVAGSRAPRFEFVVLGDSQLTHTDIFERTIHEVETLQPLFVVQVGDLIHGYTSNPERARLEWQTFQQQIDPLTMPFYPVPGNHDVTTPEMEVVYEEFWGPGRRSYSFDRQGVSVIVVDAYSDAATDGLSEEEIAWLRAELEKHRHARHIFVALHPPLHLDEEYDWMPIHNMLVEYPVRAVFTGHYHFYNFRERDGIRYFCLNTSGLMHSYNAVTGNSHNYLYVQVRGDDVNYVVKADEHIWPPDAVAPEEGRASQSLRSANQTIRIPPPGRGGLWTEVAAPVDNPTSDSRKVRMRWESFDPRWRIHPLGLELTLEEDETTTPIFDVAAPPGEYNRGGMPRLIVEAEYTSLTGRPAWLRHERRLFAPPEVAAERLEPGERWRLDGRLDDEPYENAPAIRTLYVDEEGTPAPEDNLIHVLYGSAGVMIGFRGEEPMVEGLATYAKGEIPLVFGDDDIEFFFDTNLDQHTYFRLMTNSVGTTLDSGPEGRFTFPHQVVTHVGPDFWSAEFFIPWSSFEMEGPPEPGTVWGFNVRRHRQQVEPRQRDWSKMRNVPYQPELFGLLRFE